MSEAAPRISEGAEFARAVAKLEDFCEAISARELPRMGKKAPECPSTFGTVLSLLDRVGSCFWQCPGGGHKAHMIQYMAARASSFARAAFRLRKLGFYDEGPFSRAQLGRTRLPRLLDALRTPSFGCADGAVNTAEAQKSSIRHRLLPWGPDRRQLLTPQGPRLSRAMLADSPATRTITGQGAPCPPNSHDTPPETIQKGGP